MSNSPEKPRPFPTYRLHSGSGRAITTLTEGSRRRDMLLGRYGSPESVEEYDRVIGKWLLNGRRFTVEAKPSTGDGITIGELLAQYREHVERLHPPPSRQLEALRHDTRLLAVFYGHLPAESFKTDTLAHLRDRMIKGGTYPPTKDYPDGQPYKPLARKVINARVQAVHRAFKWAESARLVPEGRAEHLRTLPPLMFGNFGVRESAGVEDVSAEVVDAVKPFMSRTIKAMVEVQLLAGCRPGEVCIMRSKDIDTSGETWTYRPSKHKGQWRGRSREILLGPRAQLILRSFIGDDPEQYLFRPAAAAAERARINGTIGGRKIAPHYTRFSYARAILRACDRANGAAIKEATESAERDGRNPPDPKIRLVPRWAPNQLRHSAATTTEAEFGIEAAAARLGHSHVDTTRIYSKANRKLAREVAAKVG